ncbi:MAG: acetylornithine deacetylase, partial [Saprospiraceae bacterium]|nr:acetylornithine deacetylase [Saprospiraceae bacterium]
PPVDDGIILSGHMDVVPVEGQPWTRSAFSLSKEKNRLYGRGAADMKGFIACCLAMLPHLLQSSLQRPIYFAFSYDEEVGCLAGPALVQNIKETYSEKPAYAIIGEPTSMKTNASGKGIAVFTTHVRSSAAHSSEIRKSVSAINEAMILIKWLNDKMEELADEEKSDQRFAPPHTTIHVGTIQGGTAVNIVADSCKFEWDVRNIPADNVSDIFEDFNTFCGQRESFNRSINAEFQIITTPKFPIVPSLDTPENVAIVNLVNQWTNTDKTESVSFGSEAGQFAEGGYQAVLCGPGNMEQGHRADEFVEIDQLEKCIAMLHYLITSQCKS